MKVLIAHTEIAADAGLADKDDLLQADAVARSLTRLGYRWATLPFGRDLARVERALCDYGPDVVVNLVESVDGRGDGIGQCPRLLDGLGISYTGCGAQALELSSNKIEAKRLLRSMGLPTPDWLEFRDMHEGQSARGRYILKSVWEHGSLGLDSGSVKDVDSIWELKAALWERLEVLNGQGFAERFIEGREFNVGVLGGPGEPQVLLPAELRFAPSRNGELNILDYESKWEEGSEAWERSVRSFEHRLEDAWLLARMQEISLACWHVFGLRGYARVDFRVHPVQGPMVIDINANPCLSPDAGFAAALTRAGLSFDQTVQRLLEDALIRNRAVSSPVDQDCMDAVLVEE